MKYLKLTALVLSALLALGLALPEKLIIPVQGATPRDWHHNTFWYSPWGSSGVHKGIDIFGARHTPVLASVSGIVLYTGQLRKGGKVIALLGPKWRIHYVAHLEQIQTERGQLVRRGEQIATLGDSGNARGKQPHVHYSILSLIPLPWLASKEQQGWKKMFFLNPHQKLSQEGQSR